MAEYEKIADVLVDITEGDTDLFKALVFRDAPEFTWSFESEQGHTVNITFRKEPPEDNEDE